MPHLDEVTIFDRRDIATITAFSLNHVRTCAHCQKLLDNVNRTEAANSHFGDVESIAVRETAIAMVTGNPSPTDPDWEDATEVTILYYFKQKFPQKK